ncbi:MAG TPA: cyclase family protein [Fibrobacteraceae bacterium]|nr:cyclase family protein [Fibrobacteraceae bacterium]
MDLLDVSRAVYSGLAVWPGSHNHLEVSFAKAMVAGDSCNVTRLCMGMHTGTHLDAPRHYLQEGKTIDEYPLDRFQGKCQVVDCASCGPLISRQILEERVSTSETDAVWIYTGTCPPSSQKFIPNFASLSLDAAEFLCERGLQMVGIDTYSVEAFHSVEHPVHKTLLGSDVLILENLLLDGVAPGLYGFF